MRRFSLLLAPLLAVLVLVGCAGRGEIAPEDTQGTIVMMGFALEGRPVQQLGYYYVLNFVDADDEPLSVTIRPRHNSHFIILDELPPGDWELVSYAARGAPGVTGFASQSLRPRSVHLKFHAEEGVVQMLSQQLTLEHGRNFRDETTTRPRFAPLSSNVEGRMSRRAERMGPEWQFNPEPIGELDPPERPERRSFLDRLFGD